MSQPPTSVTFTGRSESVGSANGLATISKPMSESSAIIRWDNLKLILERHFNIRSAISF